MARTASENDYISIGEGSNLFDDEARFFFEQRTKLTQFRDLDIKFGRNPSTNDVIIKTGDNAVKQSIKNLILTDFYERPFRPGIGAGVKQLLFEPSDFITERILEEKIIEAIVNFEPRAELLGVEATSNRDGLGYKVKIIFALKDRNQPVTFETFLEANRGS